jgi:hypothetical protein
MDINDYKEKGLYLLSSMHDFIKINDLFMGKVVSPGYVASVFGVSRSTVTQWIQRRKIRAFKYKGKEGDYMIIPIADIIDYKRLSNDDFIYDKLVR